MPRWLAVIISLVVFTFTPASAQVRARDIASATEGSEAWIFLQRLTSGIEWAVSSSRFGESQGPFCAPPNMAFTTEQYRLILRKQIEIHPGQANHWASLVMMDALKRSFPCPDKR